MRWPHALADDFFTKQLPNNVTWLLTLMYSLSQTGAPCVRPTRPSAAHHRLRLQTVAALRHVQEPSVRHWLQALIILSFSTVPRLRDFIVARADHFLKPWACQHAWSVNIHA